MALSNSELQFNKNEDQYQVAIGQLNLRMNEIELGGGTQRLDKLKAQGKMSARERIEYLVDKESFLNWGLLPPMACIRNMAVHRLQE